MCLYLHRIIRKYENFKLKLTYLCILYVYDGNCTSVTIYIALYVFISGLTEHSPENKVTSSISYVTVGFNPGTKQCNLQYSDC